MKILENKPVAPDPEVISLLSLKQGDVFTCPKYSTKEAVFMNLWSPDADRVRFTCIAPNISDTGTTWTVRNEQIARDPADHAVKIYEDAGLVLGEVS